MPSDVMKSPSTSKISGIEFISKDHTDSDGKAQKKVLLQPKNGRSMMLQRMFDNLCMSREHGRLEFTQDGKILLYDTGSSFGTYVYSKNKKLDKDEPYDLQDGDSVIFGAEKYEPKGSFAVRVVARFIYDSTKLPDVIAPAEGASKNGPPAPKPSRLVNRSDQKKDNNRLPAKEVSNSKLAPPQHKHRANKSDSNLADTLKLKRDTKRLSGIPSPDKRLSKLDENNTPGESRPSTPNVLKVMASLFGDDCADSPEKNHMKGRPDQRRSGESPGGASPNPANKGERTTLHKTLMIPWRSGLRLGDGIDALTGEAMRCALDSIESEAVGDAQASESFSTEILSHDNLDSLRNEYSMEVGASINIPAPVGFGADVKSVFSTESSTSSEVIFVQYQIQATFPMERLEDPQLKPHLRNMDPNEFRAAYGDYFVSGIERGYSCKIIVACAVKGVSRTRSVETEAKIAVESIFVAGGKVSKAKQQVDSVTLLNASVRLFGYPAGAIEFTGASIEQAFEALKNLRERGAPTGVPRSVQLRHHSVLDYCNLRRYLEISPHIFTDIRTMRNIYSRLQAKLLHPALNQLNQWPNWNYSVELAMEKFRDNREAFVDTTTQTQQKRAVVLRLLTEAERDADTKIKVYSLVQQTKQMDKGFRRFGPYNARYKWECGHLGKETGEEGQHGKVVRLKSGVEALEIDWYTPATKGSRLGALGLTRPQLVKLWSENAGSTVHSDRGPSNPSQDSGPKFHQRLVGVKATVLGWSLSCDWQSKTEPQIVVDSSNNWILQDKFEVGLDTTVSTSWHCRVTLILEDNDY